MWVNPEWIRHARGLLRPSRVMMAVVLPLILCAVTYSLFARHQGGTSLYLTFFNLLLVSQFIALALWCLHSCGQALVHERILQTFDFWRTTRLTASELIWGMVCGAPLLGYVAVGSTFPIGVISGVAAGYSFLQLLNIYLFLTCCVLFLSLVALLSSMLATKLQMGFGLATVLLLIISALPGLVDSPLPGLTAINPMYALAELLKESGNLDAPQALLFGLPVSMVIATDILYASLGTWVFIMLLRNIKKEREDIRLLSRLQLMGFAAYCNVVLYAFLDIRAQYPGTIMTLVLLLNVVILYAVGMMALTPAERLREWRRSTQGRLWAIFSENGLSWPWVASAGLLAVSLYSVANAAFLGDAGSGVEGTKRVAMSLVIVALFAVRDSLFLQWCRFHRFKQPLVAGGLCIGVYYVFVSTLPESVQDHIYLTPFWPMANDRVGLEPFALSLLIQGASIIALVYAIRSRLSEQSTGPAAV
ncbi:MAG: hypothetical protein HP494_18545 [Nitrospira sp.]|nr:hypothetical protein [Nitrospira sp.]